MFYAKKVELLYYVEGPWELVGVELAELLKP